jgi:hypothetical protein
VCVLVLIALRLFRPRRHVGPASALRYTEANSDGLPPWLRAAPGSAQAPLHSRRWLPPSHLRRSPPWGGASRNPRRDEKFSKTPLADTWSLALPTGARHPRSPLGHLLGAPRKDCRKSLSSSLCRSTSPMFLLFCIVDLTINPCTQASVAPFPFVFFDFSSDLCSSWSDLRFVQGKKKDRFAALRFQICAVFSFPSLLEDVGHVASTLW